MKKHCIELGILTLIFIGLVIVVVGVISSEVFIMGKIFPSPKLQEIGYIQGYTNTDALNNSFRVAHTRCTDAGGTFTGWKETQSTTTLEIDIARCDFPKRHLANLPDTIIAMQSFTSVEKKGVSLHDFIEDLATTTYWRSN